MKRFLTTLLATCALVSVSAAQGGDPEVPEKYSKVDEVRALQDSKKRVTFIDVRAKEQYDELHIKGALNIPLEELASRLKEVSKKDFVVLY